MNMPKGKAFGPGIVRVSTRLYESEHGEKPSGEGYWVFRMGGRNPREFVFEGLYSKGKRKAQHSAGARGVFDIEVQP